MTLTVGVDPGLKWRDRSHTPNGLIHLHDCPVLKLAAKTYIQLEWQ